jgi:hypothetical protein
LDELSQSFYAKSSKFYIRDSPLWQGNYIEYPKNLKQFTNTIFYILNHLILK